MIRAWRRWDQHPADRHRVRTLSDLIVAYTGLASATAMRRHVNTFRQAGRSLAAAIYSWIPDEPT